jgi:hypothetical protein
MLRSFYSQNDFSGLVAGTSKNFDVHHKNDEIWLCVVNRSNGYFDFLYPDGTFVGSVGKYERVCYKLNPRPQFVEVLFTGLATFPAANAPASALFIGIDKEPLFIASNIPVG